MKRRDFLGLTAGAVTAAANLPGAQTEQRLDSATAGLEFLNRSTGEGPYRQTHAGAPPHIFLITADMVSPDFYLPSRPVSKLLHLPAIRSLQQDGVFFSNAFCTVPLCAPSRASYLTGRYSYILGNGERAPQGLTSELNAHDIIWPEYLRAAGYIARHSGKCHVGTQKFIDAFGENDHPWNTWYPPIYTDDGYLDYQRRLGVKPQKYSREIIFLQQDRKTPGNSVGGWIIQENGKPFPLEAQYSYYLVHRATKELDDILTSPATRNRPIYYQLDLFDPHQPLSIPEGFEAREKELEASLELPKTYHRVRATNWQPFPDQPQIYDLYRHYWGLYNPDSLRQYRIAYALQMELVDHVVGRFLAYLKSRGLYDNSLIIFNSDHGEMNGRWALIDKGVYLYPDVLRAPLIMKPPRSMQISPHTIEAPVSLMDIGPTILGLVGVQPQTRFDGCSLLSYFINARPSADRNLLFFGGWHVGVNFACGIEHRHADGTHYLYSYNCSSPIDELYDLNAAEAENLAQRREYASIRKNMIERLSSILQQDSRWTGYWSEFRVANYFDLSKQIGDMQLSGSSR
jgi:arylsulfatase A-like enzyme